MTNVMIHFLFIENQILTSNVFLKEVFNWFESEFDSHKNEPNFTKTCKNCPEGLNEDFHLRDPTFLSKIKAISKQVLCK